MARHRVEICGVNTANIKVLNNEEMVNLFKELKNGNLAAKGIGAAMQIVSQNMDSAINRLDTMNNFPKVMSNLGISAKDSEQAIKKLKKKCLAILILMNLMLII